MDVTKKRESEKRVLRRMVAVYCRGQGHEREGDGLCAECRALLVYACERAQNCPRMREKTFCSRCPSPCYEPKKRERIRAVMRYAGPRMLLYHPIITIRHGLTR